MMNSENEAKESTVYELCFLILPSIPEDELSHVTDALRRVIVTEGGAEIDAEAPFKTNLAYSMSKTIGASRYVVSDAYLGWIKFEIDKTKALAIKTGAEKIKEILRFLLVKAPRETAFTFASARTAAEIPTSEGIEEKILPAEALESVEQ